MQGALESGVQFVSAYPGTPSSEIGMIFGEIARKNGVYFEFSANEKVAMEAGIGASFSGMKTLVAMKNFGLNVALDAFLPFVYTGTVGPTVIVVADDPSCYSSGQSEENSRAFAYLGHVPVLEPADPEEARLFTKLGFEISGKFNVPVMLRITTRVAHQRMPVESGKIPAGKKTGKFVKNVHKFVTMPPRVLEMKDELLEKIEKIRSFSEKSEANKIVPGRTADKIGIIVSGVSYLYVKEILKESGLDIPILKIGMFYPLPNGKIKSFIKGLKKVLVVEELEGYVEKEVRALAEKTAIEVHGKDLLPVTGELGTGKIAAALSRLSGKKLKIKNLLETEGRKLKIAPRFPRLCEGCPYWLVFAAIKKLAPKDVIWGGDIGCYMLAGYPPHEIQDYLLCMGSSIGIGHGIAKSTRQKVIALIGDSTFFHAGIPALINTVYNKSNPLIIVLDNRITAMTGHQPNPGMGETGMGDSSENIKIEDIAKACGVKHVKVVDPVNFKELQNVVKDYLAKDETALIVMRKMCAYYARKIKKDEKR